MISSDPRHFHATGLRHPDRHTLSTGISNL
jgi:hypothetical protein